MSKKLKLQKKQVKYQGKTIELFSLDGMTWSSNQEELSLIQERLTAMREQFAEKLVKSVNPEQATAPEVVENKLEKQIKSPKLDSAKPVKAPVKQVIAKQAKKENKKKVHEKPNKKLVKAKNTNKKAKKAA